MLSIALLLVCFYDAIIIMLIPSSATFLLAGDGMAASMISTLMAISIGLWVLYTFGFKKIQNHWICIFIFFIIFSSFHSPNIQFESVFTPKDPGLFNFKPMFESLVYFLMFMGIASLPYDCNNRGKINITLAYVGLIYSVYIIAQHCGMDQFYKLQDNTFNQLSRQPQDGGFISQPVYAAALLSICLPFIFKFKRWLIVLPIIAILLTSNRSALSAIAISGIYLLTGNKRYVLYILGAYISLLALAVAIYWAHPNFNFNIESWGRLATWKSVLGDIIHPSFPGVNKAYILTGFGIGSFSVLFPFYHQSPFFQTHNEYLEVLYTLSLIGLFLFIKSIWHIFKTSSDKTFTASLIAISVCAVTNPVWHIPQLQFLTVFLIGMVYNKENSYELGSTRT